MKEPSAGEREGLKEYSQGAYDLQPSTHFDLRA